MKSNNYDTMNRQLKREIFSLDGSVSEWGEGGLQKVLRREIMIFANRTDSFPRDENNNIIIGARPLTLEEEYSGAKKLVNKLRVELLKNHRSKNPDPKRGEAYRQVMAIEEKIKTFETENQKLFEDLDKHVRTKPAAISSTAISSTAISSAMVSPKPQPKVSELKISKVKPESSKNTAAITLPKIKMSRPEVRDNPAVASRARKQFTVPQTESLALSPGLDRLDESDDPFGLPPPPPDVDILGEAALSESVGR